MIRLTEAEIAQFSQMRDQAANGTTRYWQIYESLADLMIVKGVSPTDSSFLWLRGATEANADRGSFAALIRTYTETQYQLRYGTSIPTGKMQEASDAVAKNLLADLLGDNDQEGLVNRWPKGQVPDIGRIAFADARAVGAVLFNRDLNDTAAELQQNSAWSGSLLFSLLGSNQTGRLVSTGSGTSIDTLNDIRDVLYAAMAYKAGLQAGAATWATSTPAQQSKDATIAGATVTAYLSGDQSASSLAATLGNGATGVVGQAFKLIADIGAPKFLDMLSGAAVGKSQLGNTTAANFAERANTFFSAYGTSLQTIGAQLLPTDAAALASKARTDVNARAALAALSVVSVQVSTTTADQFSLYNPSTGQGNITNEWITDRAAFTKAVYQQAQGLGGIVPGSQNIRYFDAASNTEVLVGAGSAQRIQMLFGDDGTNTLSGQGFADRLYGGAGDDTLDGLGGSDYLEGGTGVDTYQFNSGFGKDVVSDADGQGVITIDGQALGTFSGAGSGGYASSLGAGQYAGLALVKDNSSSTGYKAVIIKGTDGANTITINNFDKTRAEGSEGYLGIKIDPTRRVALQEGGGTSFWSSVGAEISSLAGQASQIAEGAGRTFTVYLNQGAKAGETLALSVADLANKGIKAILGDTTVDADGATITLMEGQTQVSFAIVQDGELDADALGALSVTYTAQSGEETESNTWGLDLQDAGETDSTVNGDITAHTETNTGSPITRINTEGEPVTVVDTDEQYFTTDSQGNLTVDPNGTFVADNTLYGSQNNDTLNGQTGNDLIAAGAGNRLRKLTRKLTIYKNLFSRHKIRSKWASSPRRCSFIRYKKRSKFDQANALSWARTGQ